MVPLQDSKFTDLIAPQASESGASWPVTSLDCKDWDYASIVLQLGAGGVALTALKLQESDDNATWVDVVGARVGTDNDLAGNVSALPGAAAGVFVFDVDCRSRKRYLKLVATAGVGTTFASALAIQARGAIGPHQASDRGAIDVMRV